MKFTLIALAATVILAACGKNEVAESAPKKPDVPDMSYGQLTALSKNERQELERRCLGVNHPTCTDLKGQPLKDWLQYKVASCKAAAAMTGFSNAPGAAYASRQEEAKCEDLR